MAISSDELCPLTLSDFAYELPAELIAQEPKAEREGSRLLSRGAQGGYQQTLFRALPDLLPADALVIVNNTRVIAARLYGSLASGGRVEVFLLSLPQGSEPAKLRCFAFPARKLHLGREVLFVNGLVARVQERSPVALSDKISSPPVFEFSFNCSGDELARWLELHGSIPLPPYIKRQTPPSVQESRDSQRYQTVYAALAGSVAAPTAGLHFTAELIARLKERGVSFAAITLHVGAGTFLPVKSETISQHCMHQESYLVPRETLAAIAEAKRCQRKIVLVGTTTLRGLESLFRLAKGDESALMGLADRWWSTDLFVYPQRRGERFRPWVGDALLTNFHQPGSTLFMLVCALLGFTEAQALYQFAVEEKFRFLSYGDASLLEL